MPGVKEFSLGDCLEQLCRQVKTESSNVTTDILDDIEEKYDPHKSQIIVLFRRAPWYASGREHCDRYYQR